MVPVRWLGQASEEEIQTAILSGSFRFRSKRQLEALVDKIDAFLRDSRWDPFVRREGRIAEINPDDAHIKSYTEKYGQRLVDLIVTKRRELEELNPSCLYTPSSCWRPPRAGSCRCTRPSRRSSRSSCPRTRMTLSSPWRRSRCRPVPFHFC